MTPTKQLKAYVILAVALLICTYAVASFLTYEPNPPPVKDDVGICVHSLSESDAQLVEESTAGWIRIDASENLSDFGASVRNAKAYGLSVLGILDSWMFNKSTNFTLDDWRSNVTYYVSQYADYVDAWEIWNEPVNPNPNCTLLNLTVTDANWQVNMDTIVKFYFRMARVASQIIREYDPTAKILLFGGLNLYSAGDPHYELDWNFSSRLAAENITQFGDVISVHAYPWTNKTEPYVWGNYTESLAKYSNLFASSNKPVDIWVTETGQNMTDSGEKGQAQYMADSLDFFHGKVSHIFWYSLHDDDESLADFGLIHNDGAPREAYKELKKVTD